ncbi:hypothetical protein CYME_CMP044C [Cyanidioschyzon merolae strain 10D]|uniref:Uncharacterized protein n=1 Tax=Cyanidioschyzon merolae (strain NIES-3377 / 10D) TaxID=280699 RepID=M1VFG9_CYAM1|nr:hypothetical protein CYME_CMP044C [Cyanidioschyzon merolae strain 10D]BAM81707.1 hypothetical protein CYME_CMP044C [Cyanidioschyzon merolae strain 10D]|eukprot:XP_005537743.1 hypothetical protein CYME_CMP044C [Cyanidioschyzon merolae strain 10D]
MVTRSMLIVGTEAIMARRSAFATEISVSESVKSHSVAAKRVKRSLGKRCRDADSVDSVRPGARAPFPALTPFIVWDGVRFPHYSAEEESKTIRTRDEVVSVLQECYTGERVRASKPPPRLHDRHHHHHHHHHHPREHCSWRRARHPRDDADSICGRTGVSPGEAHNDVARTTPVLHAAWLQGYRGYPETFLRRLSVDTEKTDRLGASLVRVTTGIRLNCTAGQYTRTQTRNVVRYVMIHACRFLIRRVRYVMIHACRFLIRRVRMHAEAWTRMHACSRACSDRASILPQRPRIPIIDACAKLSPCRVRLITEHFRNFKLSGL